MVQGLLWGDTWTDLKDKQEKMEEKLLLIRKTILNNYFYIHKILTLIKTTNIFKSNKGIESLSQTQIF